MRDDPARIDDEPKTSREPAVLVGVFQRFATIFAGHRNAVMKMADIDRFDRALLEEMQRDNQTPARILAERVGLSQSAMLRRLRRLRADKVITADISIVSPAVLGVPVTIHVLVSLVRGSQLADAFARKLSSRPEIRQASYVTGGADFVLQLQVESMEAYAAFAREVFHDDPNVSTFYTYVAMREVVGPMSGSRPVHGAAGAGPQRP